MLSECAAVGCCEKLTKEFSFHAFPLKSFFLNEARKQQWQMAMNRWDLATKKWEPKHHDVLSQSIFFFNKKMLHRSHPAEHSVWAQIHVHRVTDLERFPVWISKDETLTPLLIVGPLFISPLSFHLSQALLGAWRYGLFHCVYSSFHNRLDLIREPAFYWVFYFIFPNYPCLFHHT